MTSGTVALSPADFERVANEVHPLLLDVRDKAEFVKGFIPNSIFIGLDGSFAPWAGEMIPDLAQPILLIAPAGRAPEAVERLSRVGYDNTLGYLDGGMEAWRAYGGEIETLKTIQAPDFSPARAENILDVRKTSEYANGHLERAKNIPLAELSSRMQELEAGRQYHLHCGSGYRSTIAASLLKARGFHQLVNVQDKVADILALETTA